MGAVMVRCPQTFANIVWFIWLDLYFHDHVLSGWTRQQNVCHVRSKEPPHTSHSIPHHTHARGATKRGSSAHPSHSALTAAQVGHTGNGICDEENLPIFPRLCPPEVTFHFAGIIPGVGHCTQMWRGGNVLKCREESCYRKERMG